MSSAKDNTYAYTENRILYLSDEVDNSSVGKLCFELLNMLKDDDKAKENRKKGSRSSYVREPIRLYINSYGGDAYDMWALIDIIRSAKTPVYTYCTGYAMSAAFKIFLAGHKRFASEHATFMYHQMWQEHRGSYQTLVEDREEDDTMQNMIEEYVAERTNLSQVDLKEIREKKKKRYIHAEEALKLGIIHKII